MVEWPCAALLNAYVKTGSAAAALAEVGRALSQAPDDEELHAFRDSWARLEERR